MIKFVHSIASQKLKEEDFERVRSDVIIIMIFLSCILMYERNDPSLLHVCDKKIEFNPVFYNSKLSVIENIRHSTIHCSITIEHDCQLIKMKNEKKNFESEISPELLINSYCNCIDELNSIFSSDTTILMINNQIKELKDGKFIEDFMPQTFSFMLMIILMYEIRYDVTFSIIEQKNDFFKSYSCTNHLDVDDYFTIAVNKKTIELKKFRNVIGHEKIEWDGFGVRFSIDGTPLTLHIEELLTLYRTWSILLTIPTIRFCTDLVVSSLYNEYSKQGGKIVDMSQFYHALLRDIQ